MKAKNQAMIRIALLASIVAGAGACGRSSGISDDKLGGLVVAEVKASDKPVDLDKAAKDPEELDRALAQPHSKVLAAIGPHVVKIATSSQLLGGSPLTDTATIEVGDKGAFHGVYTNNSDYGRETIFVDGRLYLRPRYQRWHSRSPDAPDEPARLRDAYFEAVYATWDLLAPAAQLADRGKVQVEGRVGRKIEISQTARPRTPKTEQLSQRAWRQARTIEGVTGEIVLDADKGVVLAARLAGTVAFQKDGQRYSMKITLEAVTSGIGTVVPIVAPASGEVVATPERLREVDDRDYLLQNIAPPIRRNPDGTAATPQPSMTPNGSAAGSAMAPPPKPEPKPEKKSEKKQSEEQP